MTTARTREEIFGIVRRVLVEEDSMICVPFHKVTLEARLKRDLGLRIQNYDFIFLIGGLEGEFGIEISDEEFEKLVTVGDIVDLVEVKQKAFFQAGS